MSFKNIIIMLVTLLCILVSLPGYPQKTDTGSTWEEWVADRHPDLNCPWLISSSKQKLCSWPVKFLGSIVDDGMLFEMSVQVFSKDALVNLPGNKRNWPAYLTVNQQPAAVIDHNGTPRVHLNQGNNIIRGKFLWQEIPPTLALPDALGLVKILRNAKVIETRINNNQLILSQDKKAASLDDKNALKIQVYRALQDAVPLRLTSIIKLFVSGKSREVTIGQAAIAGTKSISLQSALPARLEEDGMLRVQVKPGIYQITLESRFTGNITTISTRKVAPEWPENEYFSFIADPRIREVKISGVKSIDTSLVDIPAQWKSYPTYQLAKNDQLQLATTIRGDSAAHQNSIDIEREIWLSFDGQDAIAKDRLTGIMHQGWRLDAEESLQLGRAAVNSIPVLITNFKGHQGVEIRSPQINLETVSSIPLVDSINAVGWRTDAAKLMATIHLPPGWRAVYASGVDGIRGTWIQKWNLWDLFWLMILIAVARKLLGFKGALLMALTLVFTFHEEQAPNALWAILLAFIAIIGLPVGKYKVWLSRVAILPAALLLLTVISIAISSLRLAIYPALEKHSVKTYQTAGSNGYQKTTPPLLMQEADRAVALRSSKEQQNLYQIGDNDRVQTGPGIPTWSWNALYINSSGTVTADQQINLLLSPPLLTAIWRVINVVLLALMTLTILRALFNVGTFPKAPAPDAKARETGASEPEQDSEKNAHNRAQSSTVTGVILVPLLTFLVLLLSAKTAEAQLTLPEAQGYPPEYLLKEYENRLLQSPDCLPSCVSLNNGVLLVKDNKLSLTFALYADAEIALPLPSAGDAWRAENITLDNKQAVLLSTQGILTAYLPKGAHTITMQGEIKNAEFSINLPINIHNFRVDAPLWLIDGIRDGEVVNNNIGLTAKELIARQDTNTLAPLPVQPYAIVQRTITLGKQWRMLTRVEKLAPTVDAASFNIALLKGEQILSAYPINESGSVNVQIPKNKRIISWQSALPQSRTINLQAADNRSYSETWTLIPSSLWNVTFTGIKPIKSDLSSAQLQPSWKPWPGESLAIRVSRPEGVAGEVFTTEMVTLIQQPGKNVQKSNLLLKVRASQGTAYEIILPEGTKINSLTHDAQKMSINSANRVVVQLHPGEQQIQLEFEKRAQLSWRNSSAAIKLAGKTVNINIEYHLPRDRWLIYLTGPALGASMLYWGVLLVILIGAIVLPVGARKLHLQMPIATFDWIVLGVGFSTVNSYGILITALFFFVMAFRNQYVQPAAMERWKFNFMQSALLLLTVVCVISLLVSIPLGLLSTPEMQVLGNGSYDHYFKFFQDKVATGQLPVVTVFSLPLWFYRVVMLAWSLWVATRLIVWGKWWFAGYSRHGAWIAKPPKVEKMNKVTIKLDSESE